MKREDLFKRVAERPPTKPAAELLERIGRGRDLRHRTTWPGGSLELELQVLTRGETAAAHAAAFSACAARGLDHKDMSARAVEARVDEEMVQILAAAIRDPATHERLFRTADELSGVATDDELVALFNAYADHRHSVDPDPELMPESEFAAFEDALKKKDVNRLSAIVSGMPRHWLRSSVLRLATSPTPSSTSIFDSQPSPAPTAEA